MKREKDIPADLFMYLEKQKQQERRVFNSLNMFYTIPTRAVRMKMLVENGRGERDEGYRTAIIPAVDIYTINKAVLKQGFLKRNALSYFVAGTRKAFPFGHVYADSGGICLGNIFVPSAVPERSAAMPLETLFLHNDRNLSHGNSHLFIDKEQADRICGIITDAELQLGQIASIMIEKPGADIILNDEIWSLSADVAEQKPLPEALRIMKAIYDIVFMKEKKIGSKNEEDEQNG